MQFDIYRITGHDVGYLHCKYVGALLFKEGRAFSLAFSSGEFLARLFVSGDGAEVLAETVAATLRNIAAANPQNVSVEDVFNGEDKKDEKVAES